MKTAIQVRCCSLLAAPLPAQRSWQAANFKTLPRNRVSLEIAAVNDYVVKAGANNLEVEVRTTAGGRGGRGQGAGGFGFTGPGSPGGAMNGETTQS